MRYLLDSDFEKELMSQQKANKNPLQINKGTLILTIRTRGTMYDHPKSELKLISSATAAEWKLNNNWCHLGLADGFHFQFYCRLFWPSNS